MEFLKLANRRYATKVYSSQKVVSAETMEELKEIIRLSPSSINSQPWHFTFVTNPQVKEDLAAHSYMNGDSIKKVSVLVVFSVTKDIEKFEQENIDVLPASWKDFYVTMVKAHGDGAVRSWMENQVYLSLGYFLSACMALGLDATPMEGIDRHAYADILPLDGQDVLFAVAVGYADPSDAFHPDNMAKSRFAATRIITHI